MSQSMLDERLKVLREKADALERELEQIAILEPLHPAIRRSQETLAAVQRLITKTEHRLRMLQKGEEGGSSQLLA